MGVLETANIQISMDGRGRWLGNVFVERLWRSVKYEHLYLFGHATMSTAHSGMAGYFAHYCHDRPHQALNNRTPGEVYWEGRAVWQWFQNGTPSGQCFVRQTVSRAYGGSDGPSCDSGLARQRWSTSSGDCHSGNRQLVARIFNQAEVILLPLFPASHALRPRIRADSTGTHGDHDARHAAIGYEGKNRIQTKDARLVGFVHVAMQTGLNH